MIIVYYIVFHINNYQFFNIKLSKLHSKMQIIE